MNGTQALFAEAVRDAGRPCPPGLATWNGSDPAARFAVYRNNYLVSLLDALADTFPVTRELVGDVFFRAMARVFVDAHPPRSRILAFYGDAFPAFVETFAPAASLPYLADVARLEMLRVRAFHAAERDALAPAQIAAALQDAASLPGLRIGLDPALGVLRSRHAVVSLWAAHQGLCDIATVDPTRPESALVMRTGLEVEVLGLGAGAALFVERLLQGTAFGGAAQEAGADAGFDLAAILALLIGRGLIVAFDDGEHHDESGR